MNAYRHLTILGIIAVAALVFAGETSQQATFAEDYGVVPSTVVAAARAVVSGDVRLTTVQPFSRLITALFLHGDIEHILLNMVFLWAFGYLVSQLLGQWQALALFVFCGGCGNIAQICLDPESSIPIIGASGGVCGLEGVYFGLALRWQLPWPDVWPLAHPIPPLQLGAFALVGFLADVYFLADHDQGIAFGAHAGGFLSGFALATLVTAVYPDHADYRRSRKKQEVR
jgi:membrane associated rhomboid family serine protease